MKLFRVTFNTRDRDTETWHVVAHSWEDVNKWALAHRFAALLARIDLVDSGTVVLS